MPLILEDVRFKFDLEEPTLVLFHDTQNSSKYLGPKDPQDLLSFIKDQTGGGHARIRVKAFAFYSFFSIFSCCKKLHALKIEFIK